MSPVADVGAAAELLAEPMEMHAHGLAVLLAEQHHGADFCASSAHLGLAPRWR